MNIQDAIVTHDLPPRSSSYLNDFLSLGWRILAIRTVRRPDGDGFVEHFGYLLGAKNLLELPEEYRREIKEDAEWLQKHGF
jgi:hypothetical protein